MIGLPILEQAAIWNKWTSEESLMQLDGHLRDRALEKEEGTIATWKGKLPGCYPSSKRKT